MNLESKPMTVFVCYNRCLICGRRTNHEVCHLHSTVMGGKWPDISKPKLAWAAYKRGFSKAPEDCTDSKCPQKENDWV